MDGKSLEWRSDSTLTLCSDKYSACLEAGGPVNINVHYSAQCAPGKWPKVVPPFFRVLAQGRGSKGEAATSLQAGLGARQMLMVALKLQRG